MEEWAGLRLGLPEFKELELGSKAKETFANRAFVAAFECGARLDEGLARDLARTADDLHKKESGNPFGSGFAFACPVEGLSPGKWMKAYRRSVEACFALQKEKDDRAGGVEGKVDCEGRRVLEEL